MGRLAGHLQRDSSIGLLCPTTNFCGNEARVEPDYDATSPACRAYAARRAPRSTAAASSTSASPRCTASPRAATVLDDVGPLDEAYGDRHVRGRRLRGAHARQRLPRRVRRGRLRPPRRAGRLPQALAGGRTTRCGRRTRPTSRRSSASSGSKHDAARGRRGGGIEGGSRSRVASGVPVLDPTPPRRRSAAAKRANSTPTSQRRARAGPWRRTSPSQLFLEVSSRCNLRCKKCGFA